MILPRSYKEKDIRFYSEEVSGDYMTDETGDFALTEGHESAQQDLMNRIRTQTEDWRSHPRIGADLELLEGEPNTRETGMKGITQINETLTFDHRFDIMDVSVRAIPLSIEEIEFFIMLDSEDENIVVTQSLGL